MPNNNNKRAAQTNQLNLELSQADEDNLQSHDSKQFDSIVKRLKRELLLVDEDAINAENAERFDSMVDHLKRELSLEDDETQKKELQKVYAKLRGEMEIAVTKSVDEYEMDENEVLLMDGLGDYLPKAFLQGNGFYDQFNDKMVDLRSKGPEYVKHFAHELFNSELKYDHKEDIDGYEQDYNLPIDEVLDELDDMEKGVYGDDPDWYDETTDGLIRRFDGQSDDCKLQIMKAFLSDEQFLKYWDYELWCVRTLSYRWWNDDLIPDVEKVWKTTKKVEWAELITRRFPLDYVIAHQGELGRIDFFVGYYAVCERLLDEPHFVVDRVKLSQKQFFALMANHNIHLDDDEADSLFFSHIVRCMIKEYHELECCESIDWTKFIRYNPFENDDKHRFAKMLNCKPTLLLLPNVDFYARALCQTNNMATFAKFLKWNKFLQSRIPSFLVQYRNKIKLEKLDEQFDEYMTKNWKLFIGLAFALLPIPKDRITKVFGFEDDDPKRQVWG